MTCRCRMVAAVAMLAALLCAMPAAACVTTTEVVQRIERETGDAVIVLAEGPVADRITAGISSAIGEAVPAGGQYVLAELPDGALTYVVRFASGCATHHGRFPRQLVRTWIEGQMAEGEAHGR